MKATRPSRIVLALLAVTFTMGASAAAEAAEAGPSWRSKGKSRLSGSLAKAADGKSLGRHSDVKVEGGRARVELSGPDPGALIAAVEAAGGSVEVAGPGSIRATVPTGELSDLANDPSVGRVAPVRRYSSAVTSEGVATIGANTWQNAGKNGAGVKVAVVDLGFKGFEALKGNELPANVIEKNVNCGTKFSGNSATNHGTAVAEVVYDVAPGAELHLICVAERGDLDAVRQYVAEKGIKVVNTSFANFAARGDGQGPDNTDAGAVRRSRVENGALWVAAAGNQGETHFNFTSSGRQGEYCVDDAQAASSLQNIGNDQFYKVTVPAGRGFSALLRWDAWPVTTEDFDLLLLAAPNLDAEVLDSSLDAQGGRDQDGNVLPASEPVEVVGIDNASNATQSAYLAIARCHAGSNPRFDFFFDADPGVIFEQVNASGSISEPATSPYAMAVGAACHSANSIQPYSSQGPTIDGRVKPDITGPDANASVTFGPSANCSDGFTGTSSASPHVAGAAAILLGANTSLDPAQLQTQLEMRAADRGPAGLDSTYGYGELELGAVNVPTPPGGQRFTPAATPSRILDTRGATGGHNGKLNASETYALPIGAPVPAEATAVVLNVTAAEPEGPGEGYATIFPTGAAQPNSSNLNYKADALPSNQVVAAIGPIARSASSPPTRPTSSSTSTAGSAHRRQTASSPPLRHGPSTPAPTAAAWLRAVPRRS